MINVLILRIFRKRTFYKYNQSIGSKEEALDRDPNEKSTAKQFS